ncbi:MAG: hypothetical protein SGILL_002194 [Bacillariaceae sp.]
MFHICCCSCLSTWPYGIIILTLVYAIFVLIVELAVPVDCLNEPCNSEGLDNSVLGWATDFYIAAVMMGMAMQLWCFVPQKVYVSAILAIFSMGVAYVLGGIGHSIYTNSGFDDNAGQQEFYITWAISFTFMTLSIEETYRFIRAVSSEMNTVRQCTRNFLTAALVLVVLAWMATSGGYVWCATEKDLHVNGAIDTVPPLEEGEVGQVETCLQMAAVAEFTWYTCFSLFWIPAGLILRATVLETQLMEKGGERLVVYGFRAAWACLWMMVIPWTFGIMLIVYAGVAAIATGQEGTQVYEDIYGAVIYHYGMMLGYYFLHNVAYSLPRDERIGRIADVPNNPTSLKRKQADEESC